MTAIYLHIGLHKTGSTAIQKMLHENIEWLLNRDIYYPPPYSLGAQHRLGSWLLKSRQDKLVGQEKFKQAFVKIVHTAEQKNVDILISSEIFSEGVDFDYLSHMFHTMNVNVKVIAYIRRQDLLLESAYNQILKATGRIINLLECPCYHIDIWNYLQTWEALVGDGNVMVKLYEKDAFEFGSITYDFLTTIGINEFNGLIVSDQIINESMGLHETQLLEEIIPHLGEHKLTVLQKVREKIKSILKGNDARMVGNYLSTKDRLSLMSRCEEGNRKILEKYFPHRKILFSPVDEHTTDPGRYTWAKLMATDYLHDHSETAR